MHWIDRVEYDQDYSDEKAQGFDHVRLPVMMTINTLNNSDLIELYRAIGHGQGWSMWGSCILIDEVPVL